MKMIARGLAVGALAVLAVSPLAAQTRVGFKAGLSSATLVGDDVDDASSRNAVSGGAFLTLSMSPAFSIQPELLFMSKGASTDVGDLNDGVLSVNLSYIELAVLGRYSIGSGPLRPTVFVGPTLGYNVGCEIELDDVGAVDCDQDEFDVATIKSTEFGGVIGAGIDYDMGGLVLVADARYGLGLTNINDTGSDADVKNRAWTFMAGFSVPLGGR